MGTQLFEGLPRPASDRLVLYVLGAGFGESQVIAFPDGRWMVVDSCLLGDTNLPLELLRFHGVKTLDLLAATHGDLDHLRGIDELISTLDVQMMLRFPGFGSLFELLQGLLARSPRATPELTALQRALEAGRELMAKNRAWEAGTATFSWPPGRERTYTVEPIAPTPHDLHQYQEALQQVLVDWKRGKPALHARVRQFLLGQRARLAPKANILSLAFSMEWGQRRLLLGGDVESPRSPRSGWRGVLEILHRFGREQLVRDVSVVKVSHHGSAGAFCEEAWKLHAATRRVELAVLTPFSRGRNPPPHAQALKGVSHYSERLGITAPCKLRLPGSGWQSEVHLATTQATAPCVALSVPLQGPIEVFLGRGARCLASM